MRNFILRGKERKGRVKRTFEPERNSEISKMREEETNEPPVFIEKMEGGNFHTPSKVTAFLE